MAKIVHLSDTHGDEIEVPNGDILIHTGDFTRWRNSVEDAKKLNDWFGRLPHPHKIVVPGNHDSDGAVAEYRRIFTSATLLIDEETTVAGIRIYGTPWSMPFGSWSWMRTEEGLRVIYSKIPEGVHVIASHGPAYGFNDLVERFNGKICEFEMEHTGSKALLETVERVKPKVLLSGHIHEAYGVMNNGSTTFYNSAINTKQMRPTQLPQVFDLEPA